MIRKKDGILYSKGSVGIDALTILVIMFVGAIIIVSIYQIVSDLNQPIYDMLESNMSKDIITEQKANYPSIWDFGLASILIGMWLFAVISAFFIDSHPVFFVISLIFLIPTLMVAIVLANIYDDLYTDATLSTFYSSFPIMYHFFSHLLIYMTVMAFSIMGALYAKWRVG